MDRECKFNELIATYYDGVLPDEQAFNEHLLNCMQCIEKLLCLERDLFFMENIPLKNHYKMIG